MLLNKKGNTYNVDETFDYFTIKAMVIKSLERVVRKDLSTIDLAHIVTYFMQKVLKRRYRIPMEHAKLLDDCPIAKL